MLRLAVACFVCLFFLKSLVLVDSLYICPPANAISPCDCGRGYDETTTSVVCTSQHLTDSQTSAILDAYLATPNVSQVDYIDLSSNLLTHVPVQVKSLTQLRFASFYDNSITSIESGAFNLADTANPLSFLDLGFNQLTTIAPGAFKGFHFPFRKIWIQFFITIDLFL